MARNPDRLIGVDWRDEVEVIAADVLDPDSLEGALSGIEVVYYPVHAMGHAKDFERTDRVGAENTVRAAERAGVSRIVYLGGLDRMTRMSFLTISPVATRWAQSWPPVRYRWQSCGLR